MANLGSILKVGMQLENDDCLTSVNGLYSAYLHNDGNFCVYLGPKPDSKLKQWESGKKGTPGLHHSLILYKVYTSVIINEYGRDEIWRCVWESHRDEFSNLLPFFLRLNDDGSLGLYIEQRPDKLLLRWSSVTPDSFVEISELTKLEYHVKAAKIIQSGPLQLFRQTLINDTDVTQSSEISGSETVTETRGWNDSQGIKIGVSATQKFTAGIPLACGSETTISLSVEVNRQYSWNESYSKSKSESWKSTLVVPPHHTYVALVTARITTLAVPYTLTATALFKSGAKIPVFIHGIYVGTNSHDTRVHCVKESYNETETVVTVEEITNTAE
ncbi:MAG: ETX/MTX2 family pore-forming toxin [Candidatus Methylumidiphilus sp.]